MLYAMGIIFLVVGFILKAFPPRKINFIYGYRTNLSMKNQEIWDEAQRYSANSFIVLGLAYLAGGFVFTELIKNLKEGWQVTFFLAGIIAMIIVDELHLRKKFYKNRDGKTGL